MRGRRAVTIGVLAALGMFAVTACTPQAERPPVNPSADTEEEPTAEVVTLAEGLEAPWSVVRLDDGGALISQRDDGSIIELTPDGEQRTAGTVPGVVSGGESGLHGLALRDDDGTSWLYAYHGAEDDNRVVRMPLTGEPGSFGLNLDALEVVIDGIPRAGNHNGGRIAFGPDDMLYVATGDTGQADSSQDLDSLGGKILRLTPDGDPAPGNPFDSAVYSLGHRNVQGLAWDANDNLWASEFGQNTWDELNLIDAGGDYGWPAFEGMAGDEEAIDPVAVWAPDQASPSGIAVIDEIVHVASLRGERLWLYDVTLADDGAEPWELLAGEYGRLRDVLAGPDGKIWLLTNNTDGRGDAREGDDRLIQLTLPDVQNDLE